MFFIVRCIFWLSLVFLNLPDGGPDVSASKFIDMASAHVGSLARSKGEAIAQKAGGTLVARVADSGAEWCQAHGEACADAVLAAMVSKVLTGLCAGRDRHAHADRQGIPLARCAPQLADGHPGAI